jgi:hypothetical protein
MAYLFAAVHESGCGHTAGRAYAAVCPLLVEADMRLLDRDSGFDPKQS